MLGKTSLLVVNFVIRMRHIFAFQREQVIFTLCHTQLSCAIAIGRTTERATVKLTPHTVPIHANFWFPDAPTPLYRVAQLYLSTGLQLLLDDDA